MSMLTGVTYIDATSNWPGERNGVPCRVRDQRSRGNSGVRSHAREDAESAAAAKLVDQGHLIRLWKRRVAPARADRSGCTAPTAKPSWTACCARLPLYEWMRVTVTPLEPHPNDPAVEQRVPRHRQEASMSSHVPEPRLTQVYRLEATLAPPLELGETAQGRRRIVPLTGGTFSGPEISGRLLPGASADWQIVLAGRHRARRHPLPPADRPGGSPLCPVTQHPPRQPGGARAPRARRGRRPRRVHVSDLNPDRDGSPRPRLAEQGHLHQRRRSPGRRRHLRDLPRRMSAAPRPVSIVTAAKRDIGTGLAAAFHRCGYGSWPIISPQSLR